MIIRDRVLFVNLNFPREYPFQPPKVLIYKDGNKYNYLDLLYLNKEWYDYFSLKDVFVATLYYVNCIPNNIKQVIEEIQNNLDYKLRIREIMICRSIVKQLSIWDLYSNRNILIIFLDLVFFIFLNFQ